MKSEFIWLYPDSFEGLGVIKWVRKTAVYLPDAKIAMRVKTVAMQSQYIQSSW